MTPTLPLPRRFRWMPGMMRLRCAPGMADHLRREGRVPDGRDDWPADGCIPDLTDPATLGCLLALVREAYGRPDAYASVNSVGSPDMRGWYLCRTGHPNICHPTEAAALWAALEDAP